MKRLDFRRRREGKTNYKKRLALLKSEKIRLVIRKSLKHIIIQLVEYNEKGDKILVGANSKELEKLGWKAEGSNLPAAYLTGYLMGKKAAKKNIKEAILDTGLASCIKGCKIYAALKGAVDAGLKMPYSKDVLPSDEKIKGKHIADYANKLLKEDKQKYDKIFSRYAKLGIKPEEITNHFEEIKKKI